MEIENPICLALDLDSPEEALEVATELRKKVGVFKLGPRLTNVDSSLVSKISELAPVFVDHKYFDIPSTMEAAVRSIFAQGATYTTVHASAGRSALKQLAEVERELNRIRPFKILAVTVLTSFTFEDLPPFVQATPISKQVLDLVDLCIECGITGVVCSPHEIEDVRNRSPEVFIVTPGIRMDAAQRDDQRRTLSPLEAINAGSNLLVVGRPVLSAPDRKNAVARLLKALG